MRNGRGVCGLKAVLLLAAVLLGASFFCASGPAWAESDIITGGVGHTVVIKSDGTLWAWGYNASGQLGDGTTASKSYPVKIGSATNWAEVAAGAYFTVAIKTDGTLWTWGNNAYGQLGIGNTVNKNVPTQVGTDTDWASVAAGAYHTVALKTDGTLWAWGRNNNGQLGDGSTNNSTSPVQIGSDADWSSVTAGWAHSLSVKTGGTLWAWGYNANGQLGIGNTVDQDAPVQVETDTDWEEVSAGNYHTLARKTGGTIWAWGSNLYQQLGDGTTVSTSSPQQVGADANWASIAAGGDHNLALKTADTLWAWGKNTFSQLGDGSTVNSGAPIQIGTDTNWAEISGAYNHSIALKTGNSLWTWGRNANGQIGNNTTTDRTTPLRIRENLIVSALSATPAVTGAGKTISVSDTTKNIGLENAGGTSQTCFYLSADTTLGGDTSLGCRTAVVPALAAGASSTASTDLVIPSVATGTYYVIAKADSSNTVTETYQTNLNEETDNTKASAAIKIGPDLTVSALAAPATAGAGASADISDTTKNQGGGDAVPTFTTAFYLSNDTVFGGDTFLASRAIVGLAAGASNASTTSVPIPALTATGTYYIIARADNGDAVSETNETNNTKVSAEVRIGPDLDITALTVPATAGAGSTITVSDITKNIGGGSTGGSSTTKYFLSANTTLDSGDTEIGGRAVGTLAGGQQSSGSDASVTIPPGTSTGIHYIIAKADAGATATDNGVIAETIETNNTAYRAITIGPDLVVSALTVPAVANGGSAVPITDTTKNNGAGTAGASTTSFYLSANTILDGGDTLLSPSRAVGSLAWGETSTGTTDVTLPSVTGIYYIIAKADADEPDDVDETSETNNTRAAVIKIGPDLAVSALTVPATAAPGDSISVSDTTKNNGGGAAGTSETCFYLSIDTVLGGDSSLGCRTSLVPALGPGLSNSASTNVPLPGGTPTGKYFIIAMADNAGSVAETYENNNTRAAAISIGPNLVVSALSAPISAAAGTSISVSDTTKNSGAGPTGTTSTTAFYLSNNTVLDGADTLLASRTVPSLGTGATNSASTSVPIPGGTGAGTHYIIAKADNGSAVIETSETDNTRAVAVKIGPDLTVAALSAPASAASGAVISVSDTTKNNGGGAAGTSETCFYLSIDTVLGGDTSLGCRTALVPVLAPGATSTASTNLTLPSAPAGTYYIISKADNAGTVPETNENNNTRYVSISITP